MKEKIPYDERLEMMRYKAGFRAFRTLLASCGLSLTAGFTIINAAEYETVLYLLMCGFFVALMVYEFSLREHQEYFLSMKEKYPALRKRETLRQTFLSLFGGIVAASFTFHITKKNSHRACSPDFSYGFHGNIYMVWQADKIGAGQKDMKNFLTSDERLRSVRLRGAAYGFAVTLLLSFFNSVANIFIANNFFSLNPKLGIIFSMLPWFGGGIFFLGFILLRGHSHAIRDEVNSQPGRKNSFLLMLISGSMFSGLSLFVTFYALGEKSLLTSLLLAAGFVIFYACCMYFFQLRHVKDTEDEP